MASQVEVDEKGRIIESEERWRPIPYVLTREDARNLRAAICGKQQGDRLAKWRKLEPLFVADVWEQVLAHIEGVEG